MYSCIARLFFSSACAQIVIFDTAAGWLKQADILMAGLSVQILITGPSMQILMAGPSAQILIIAQAVRQQLLTPFLSPTSRGECVPPGGSLELDEVAE